MQPSGLSSLIFVVIIGVWAAYFIQYWVRRREHLATARSVDQVSETLRVLELRNPAPVADPAAGRRGSYAASPAGTARGPIHAKPASPSSAGPWPIAPEERGLDTGGAGHPARSAAGRHPGRQRLARRLVLLGACLTALAVVPLVVLHMLPLPALAAPVVSVGGSLAWVRRSAKADQRTRRRAREAEALAAAARRSAEARLAAPAPAAEPAHLAPEPTRAAVPEPAVARGSQLYDIQAVEAARHLPVAEESAPPVPLVDEDDIPLTWDPVPVPRPTYTMKARVTRPAPTSADLVGGADPGYAAHDAVPVRRVAGG